MRIEVKIELRRPARRSLALVLGALLLLTPAVVLANHQFPDVPTGHTFHSEVSAIAKAGITAGFADGGYHPSDPVTRQAMAAFMHRGFGRVGLAVNTQPTTASVDVDAGSCCSSLYVPVRQLTITVPGQTNSFAPNQLVYLQGHVEFGTAMSLSKGCPCLFTATIEDLVTGFTGPYQSQTFAAHHFSYYSFEVEALLAAPPGPRTYRLWVGLNDRASHTNDASFHLANFTSLSAMTFPFGSTGSNHTSAPAAENEPVDADQLPERRAEE